MKILKYESIGRFFLLILALLTFVNEAQAVFIDPTKCYFSDELLGNQRNDYLLRPANAECSDICALQCEEVYSQKDVGGMELNPDVLYQCMAQCQAGVSPHAMYGNRYRSGYNASPLVNQSDYVWSTPPSSTASNYQNCPTTSNAVLYPGNNALETEFIANQGDTFQVQLATPALGYQNELIMCGQQSAIIEPSDGQNSYIISFNNSDYPSAIRQSYSMYNLNARNSVFTDTGIDIKNGDYLSISYEGEYCTCSSVDAKLKYGLYIKGGSYSSTWDSSQISTSNMFSIQGDASQPALDPPSFNSYVFTDMTYTTPATILSIPKPYNRYAGGATTSYNVASCTGCVVNSNTKFVSLSGLLSNLNSNKFFRLAVAHPDSTQYRDNLGGHKISITRKGCYYNNGSRVQYAFSNDTTKVDGQILYNPPAANSWNNLSAISQSTSQIITANQPGKLFLRIKPILADNPTPSNFLPSSPYSGVISATDNCASYNGGVSNDYSGSNNDNYRNCEAYRSLSQNINQMFAPSSAFGQYFLFINKAGNAGSLVEEIISTPIYIIRNYLFGDDPVNGCQNDTANTMETTYNLDCGVVPKIFQRFIQESLFVDAVRAMIVFYFAFSALSFFIGLSPITQQEAISRLIKLSVVVTLISSDGWNFFNNYLFQFFSQGSLELLREITIIAQNNNSISYRDLINNPGEMFFSYFDLAITLILSKVLWFKVEAILLSSFFGIFIIVVIIKAIFNISMSVLKALIIYLLSLLGMGVLFMLAPIFISFVLFRTTQPMFVAWLKQLLVFALQPVIVIAGMLVLSNLVLLAVNATFAFSVCKACYIGIYIPFVSQYICFISAYTTVSAPFNPTPFAIPMELITSCFCLSIIAAAMSSYTEFTHQLTNRIILSGGGLDFGRSYGHSQMDEIMGASNPLKAVAHLTFMDRETRAARKKVEEFRDNISKRFGSDKDKERKGRGRSRGQGQGGGGQGQGRG